MVVGGWWLAKRQTMTPHPSLLPPTTNHQPPSTMRDWSERLTATLSRYDEALVRKVAARLLKPRNFWPVDALISRCVETINTPAVLDRRLDDLAPASKQVLGLIGHSRQPVWSLGNLVYSVMALG